MIWSITGAVLLMMTGLISVGEGYAGILKGSDVYLFLTGMMLLSETAREENLFDWLAACATRLSKGSGLRLFGLIYLVGIAVTVFLSNDATAVVLTPAVAAATKSARIARPLPYLFICAFVANAASFVLPISNPANLVIYGKDLPLLFQWLQLYLVPSVVAIAVTYFVLLKSQKKFIPQTIDSAIVIPPLTHTARLTLGGIFVTAAVLMICSARGIPLGLPTAITGIVVTIVVLVRKSKSPLPVLNGVSWSVLPLVAGLFVIVQGLDKTGFTGRLSALLSTQAGLQAGTTSWCSGIAAALASNAMNNLPVGLIAGNAVQSAHLPEMVKSAILAGVDLGPNLSVGGSLATILWVVALRRDNIEVSATAFLKVGITVMSMALLATLAVISLLN